MVETLRISPFTESMSKEDWAEITRVLMDPRSLPAIAAAGEMIVPMGSIRHSGRRIGKTFKSESAKAADKWHMSGRSVTTVIFDEDKEFSSEDMERIIKEMKSRALPQPKPQPKPQPDGINMKIDHPLKGTW